MYDFALIIHPTHEELLHRYEPGMKRKSRHLVRKVLEWMKPFKAAEVEGLKSNLGRTSKGVLVMCPLLSEQMVGLNPKVVTKAVIEAARFAETLNVKIIGLTAFASLVGNRGLDIASAVKTPVTNGMSFTLAMEPEAIFRGMNYMGINPKTAKVVIFGITSPIGKMCLNVLGPYVRKVFATVRNEEKFLMLKASLAERNIDLERIDILSNSVYQADLIVLAANSVPAGFDFTKVKPGTVIFDASYPRKIPTDLRNDILVVDGVAIRPPGETKLNFDFGLPEEVCFPCMAEPMILALEHKYESYSLGKNITPERIKEIYKLGNKHGFEIAELTSGERVITKEKIVQIRNAVSATRKKRFFSFR